MSLATIETDIPDEMIGPCWHELPTALSSRKLTKGQSMLDALRYFLIGNVARLVAVATLVVGGASVLKAQVVPGTGEKLTEVGDDFEDENWSYVPNLPKSSNNIDHQVRYPSGQANNNRWFESLLRGQPDVVERVQTPAGGLPNSKGALKLRSVQTGIPNAPSYKMQQDDFIMNGNNRFGGTIQAMWTPNVVARVYMPPFEQWERRTGSSFGFRIETLTHVWKPSFGSKLFKKVGKTRQLEQAWPGMFVQLNAKGDVLNKEDTAVFVIRANENGNDFVAGPVIREPGWWTLGMTLSSDGRVHYYATKGTGPLRVTDHIATTMPYGEPNLQMNTVFFNVMNSDNGRTWSTEWIVDDVEVFFVRR